MIWEVPAPVPAPWFLRHGVGVFPLRPRGKEPACASWDDYVCTPSQADLLVNYGVRLGRLAVLDTDSPESERWAVSVAPATPFVVTTARGQHRYYRLGGPLPKFIHRQGLTVEFRNAGQYVVGPGSVHPSGVVYTARDWSWCWQDIPFFPPDFLFDDRAPSERGSADGQPYEFPEFAQAGERHDHLFRQLRSCKAKGWDRKATREIVTMANRSRCRPPLVEDHDFERWFNRAWNNHDRPFAPPELSGVRGL